MAGWAAVAGVFFLGMKLLEMLYYLKMFENYSCVNWPCSDI